MSKWYSILAASLTFVCVPARPGAATTVAAASKAADAQQPTAPAADMDLPAEQQKLLQAWYEQLGPRRTEESFGRLIVRAGRTQLGKAYHDPPQTAQPESLHIDLSTFQCVSFVETTLAVARCTWLQQQTTECFLDEVKRFRYRDGQMDGYGSRLHYFTDWLEDNTGRQRFANLSAALGGRMERFVFNYMSRHQARYPAMAASGVAAKIAAVERRLSAAPRVVVDRETSKRAQTELEPGDLVAIVSSKYPGLLIRHAGFIDLDPGGRPRLLHASSYQKRVLVRRDSIARYLATRPDRRGMIVARPLPP